MDKQADEQMDDPITRCLHQTFQAGGMKINQICLWNTDGPVTSTPIHLFFMVKVIRVLTLVSL